MLQRVFQKLHAQSVIKTARRCAVALLIISMLLLIAGLITLGAERGRLWLTHTLIDQVNQSTDIHIALTGLEMPTWELWRAQTIRIDRGAELWLIAEQIELDWQPSALLNQRVVVDQLRATTVSVHNLPASAEREQVQEKTTAKGGGITDIAIPNIQLRQLKIDSLNLYGFYPPADDKSSLSYSVSAEASWLINSPLQLRVEAKGLNDNPATLNVQMQSKNWIDFTLEGSLQEPANGFFSSLLQLPAEQAIDADFVLAVKKQTDRYKITIQSLNFPLAKRALSAQGNMAIVTETVSGSIDVYVDDLALVIDNTQHSVTGRWVDQQLDIKLNLTHFPLDIITPWQPAVTSGELTAQLALTGTIERPRAVGNLTLNTVYQDLPVAVDFRGAISKSQIEIDNLQATLDQSEITAKGKLDLAADTSALNVSVNNFNIKTLDAFNITRPDNLNATLISAEASLSGPVGSLNGDLTFSAKGDYEAQAFSANAQITKKASTVLIKNATLTVAEGGSISAKGNLQADTLAANMLINMQAMPLTMLKLASINIPETLSGHLQTQLTLKGNLRKPGIQGKAQLQGLYDAVPFLLAVEGRFQNNDTQIEKLQLFTLDEEILSATGHYQAEQFDLRVQAQKLPTQLLSDMGLHIQPGNFSAVLHARGNLNSPELTGNLKYETVLRGYNESSEQQDIRFIWALDISTSEQAFNFASTFKRESETPGELVISIPKQPYLDYISSQNTGQAVSSGSGRFPVNASVAGNFNLQIISFLLDPDLHRLTGELMTDIDISGTLASPIINGALQIRDSRYENPLTGTLVESINCQLNVRQTMLNFDVCQATDGDKGSYSLSGNLNLPFNQSVGLINLDLRVQSANVLRRPDFESEATGAIKLAGDFNSVLASGNLNLSPLTIMLDSQFSSGIPSLNIEEVESLQAGDVSGKEQKLAMPDVQFNLTLTAGQQAYLRGRGLEAELQGKITLYGNLKQPLYDGNIKTLRGVFELFNKPFKLESGLVNFANDTVGLAITGVYERSGQRIQAELSGSMDQLKLHLSAVPAMPEDEILAFIIFGKSIQRITPFEAVQLALAVQQLRSENSFFDPIGSTRKMLNVDTFSVESVDNGKGESGVNVGIGKYLNDRVYLEFERTPNPSQPWKGNVEIELAPNLNLESSTGGKTGIEGAELKWKKDY